MKINHYIALILMLCLGLMYSQPIRAQEWDSRLDIEPRWSPDGQWISFISNRAGKTDLWIVDHTGGNLRNLTESIDFGLSDFIFSWSPDSLSILFSMKNDIYIVYLDGRFGNLTKDLPMVASLGARWSPDGRKIVFYAYENEKDMTTNIWTMDADGSHAELLTFGGFSPQWLSESNTIIYSISSLNEDITGVYSIDVISKETKQIFKGDLFFNLAPSKDLIAFIKTNPTDQFEVWLLSLMPSVSPDPYNSQIVFSTGFVYDVELSSDGDYISYILSCNDGNLGIWIASIEDHTTLNVVPCDAHNMTPRWSPDGNFIVFVSDRSGNGNDDIWLVDVHTSALINLTSSNSR